MTASTPRPAAGGYMAECKPCNWEHWGGSQAYVFKKAAEHNTKKHAPRPGKETG